MAGYSEEIMNEARQVIMPKAKTGDSDDESDEDPDDSDDSEKVDVKGRKKNKGIKKKEKYHDKRGENIRVKDKRWIMQKKERQRK
jgi:hypothetical protein